MATAPARIQSPAFSRVTPPVGISRTCGSGPRTSLKNAGPERRRRKHLDDVGARPPRPREISVGVKQPGITATSCRVARLDRPPARSTGLTTNARAGVDHRRAPSPRRAPCRRRSGRRRAALRGQLRDQLDRAGHGHRDLDRGDAAVDQRARRRRAPACASGSRITATTPAASMARTTSARDRAAAIRTIPAGR